MNDKINNIIGKIQKLRALAGSTHSKNEAEVCIAQAARLIALHQLSEAEVAAKMGVNNDPIDLETESIIYESGRLCNWMSELALGLARLNGLFIYNAKVRGGINHRKVNRYRVIGRQSDVAVAMYCMNYLADTIRDLASDYVPGGSKRGVNPERESWCLGCVRGFLDKMNTEKNDVMKQASSVAMVFIGNKSEEAERAFLQKTGITLTRSTYRSQAKQDFDTYNSGYRKGQTLNVNPALNK